eukprot:GCRY01000959.1.p1 GENE.GCRY01000959.1~~GCRY01000959.1.p1  ORF type:complete len:753 (+),score=238.58 GCRY01000959.1:283-2541(+)
MVYSSLNSSLMMNSLPHLLISKMLDLDTPTINEKMCDYLTQDGVVETLCSFLSLPPLSSEANSDETQLTPDQILSTPLSEIFPLLTYENTHREREWEHQSLKRSYQVHQIIRSNSKTCREFIVKTVDRLVESLLRVFDPRCEGNFYHVAGCLTYLCQFFGNTVHSVVGQNQFMNVLLEYIHEPAIPGLLITLIKTAPQSTFKVQEFYGDCGLWPLAVEEIEGDQFCFGTLFPGEAQTNFLHSIVQKIHNPCTPEEDATALIEFLQMLVSSVYLLEHCAQLFGAMNGYFFNSLFAVLLNTEGQYARVRQAAVGQFLSAFAVIASCEAYSLPVAGKIVSRRCIAHLTWHVFAPALFVHLEALAALLLNDQSEKLDGYPKSCAFSAYFVPQRFTTFRLDLLTLLETALQYCPFAAARLLPTAALAHQLVLWFCAYPHNNMFHTLFVKVMAALVGTQAEPVLREVFANKFLSRLLKLFAEEEQAKGSRHGHLLNFFNVLRLHAEHLPPTAFFASYLLSHDLWKQTLPLIISETLKMLKISPELCLLARETEAPFWWRPIHEELSNAGAEPSVQSQDDSASGLRRPRHSHKKKGDVPPLPLPDVAAAETELPDIDQLLLEIESAGNTPRPHHPPGPEGKPQELECSMEMDCPTATTGREESGGKGVAADVLSCLGPDSSFAALLGFTPEWAARESEIRANWRRVYAFVLEKLESAGVVLPDPTEEVPSTPKKKKKKKSKKKTATPNDDEGTTTMEVV